MGLMTESDDAGNYDQDGNPLVNRTWRPVDVSNVLDGTWTPPEATVGRRSDGHGIFYRGKQHTVASESEAGKTWLVLSASQDEIKAHNHVVYLDFEDDAGPLIGRLAALGVDPESIRGRFHYIRPEEPLTSGVGAYDLAEIVHEYAPTLAVIDGVTEAMTLHGMDPLSNADAAKFGRMLPRKLAEAGCATVSLDHVTKSSDNRGRYSLGAVHKLNGLDGAAFVLDNRKPFGVGLTGKSTIRIAKDRPGQLRRHSLPGAMAWFGDLVLTSHADEFSEVQVEAPVARTAADSKPTLLMSRVAQVMTEAGKPLSQRQIIGLIGGRREYVIKALSHLQVEGYVSDETPHSLLRPYVQEANST